MIESIAEGELDLYKFQSYLNQYKLAISAKKTKENLMSLLIDDIEIKATVLTKTKNGWTENNCSFLSAAEKNVIKFNINEESTDDDITIDYYNLRRIIRHCRDANIPLTLSNKENDYIIIIEHKYLRLLKYCIILQVIANEEKEKINSTDNI